VVAGASEKNTEGPQFGHSIAALGDIDGDGVGDLGVGANNEGQAGVLYVLTLNADGTVKTQARYSADDKDVLAGPFASLAGLPAKDRLCRSMSAPGDVAGDGGFTLMCGAGSHTTGDLWLFSFKPSACATGASATCATFPSGLYNLGSTPLGWAFAPAAGFSFCKGGTEHYSNWDHGTQLVTGKKTLDECKAKCAESSCEFMTTKAGDGVHRQIWLQHLRVSRRIHYVCSHT
jgi:hypothetical protein